MKPNFKLIFKIFFITFVSILIIFVLSSYILIKNNSYINQSSVNLMILGLDKRDDRLEKTETTDSIIFASLDFKTAKLKTISLPRDLWDYELNTKINDIYPQAEATDKPFEYVQNSFSKLIGQKIDNSIIITTNNLIDFVKIINGVDLYLDKGFKDEKYPNPGYITNPQAPIYKTIEFSTGQNHLDESNITEFVRSRKSAETAVEGGTDLGRIQRQQQLIEAIISKIKTKKFISNPKNLINLYNFWHQKIQTNLTDQNILSITLMLGDNIKNFSMQKYEIPIGEKPKDGIIYHPTKFINKQWVFIPQDKEYKGLQEFIKNSLSL